MGARIVDSQLLPIFVNITIAVSIISLGIDQPAQERAILLDREPVTGQLEIHPALGVVFRGPDELLLPARQIRRVEAISPPAILPGTSPAHRVHLWGNETLSGQVHAIDGTMLQLNSSVGERVKVPLYLVNKITHFRGDAVLIRDDFEGDLPLRQLAGSAQLDDRTVSSGRQAVRLAKAGDELEYHLARPIGAGWVEARVFDSGETDPALQWVCELEFESRGGPRAIGIILGWTEESYGLATPQGPSLQVQHIARKRGWSRLGVRFAPDRTTILIDEAVLTHRSLSAGSLRAVRFLVQTTEDAAEAAAKKADIAGFVDDLQIAATTGSSAERQPTPDQDDILLANGDQLFGRVESATESELVFAGEFGTLDIAWTEIQEVHFEPRAGATGTVTGQRISLHSASASTYQAPASDHDTMEGVLSKLTPEFIELENPFLGSLRFRRDEMRSIDFLSSGRWLAIDPGFHHLGDQVNDRLQVPHPEGNQHVCRFSLEEVPETADLVMSVVEMNGHPPSGATGKRSESEEWRTYVEINGKLLDREGLNHRLPLNYRGSLRITVPIGPGILQRVENMLRIYQTPQKDDARSFDDCGIFGIGLNYPGSFARP